MGKLIRCITNDGLIMAAGLDSTDIVSQAEKYHKSSATVTAALGRTLTATSLMGNALKGENNTVTVKIDGNGPAGAIVCAADSKGNVRGYPVNPKADLPPKPNGKLDVSGVVGNKGTVYVIKDLGLKEPYNGFVPIVSGEIAEDITAYFAVSEQIPTVCSLGVLVNPDLSVNCAGGYLIQLLPAARGDEAIITKLEENIKRMPPITDMMSKGTDIEQIINQALSGFNVEILESTTAVYKCTCSRERFYSALQSLEKSELAAMAAEMDKAEVHCEFCNKNYVFSKQELKKLAEK